MTGWRPGRGETEISMDGFWRAKAARLFLRNELRLLCVSRRIYTCIYVYVMSVDG